MSERVSAEEMQDVAHAVHIADKLSFRDSWPDDEAWLWAVGEVAKVIRDRRIQAEQAVREEVENELAFWAGTQLLGQPKPYSWARQNYNSGHDQAMHALVKEIERRRSLKEPR